MADIVLNVEVRERTGTGGARAARREGLVPGVLYGGDKDPVAITVRANEFRKALYTGKLLGHLVTVNIAVPVHSQNQEASPGLKRGGTLNIVLHEITLSVPADEIPEDIVHDLTGLDIGDSIRIADLKLAGSAKSVVHGATVVATIVGASAQMAEEAAAEAAEGGAA